MPRFDPDDVRRFYDRSTAGFVQFGQGGGAIHRAVWGPGVASRAEAFHFVEERIRALLSTLGRRPLHALDLGCGVGASMLYLAGAASSGSLRVTGVTLSAVQARLAQARILAAGLDDRVTCLEGDFTAMPPSVGVADLAYAIESFAHGPDASAFFAECARVVRPGGLLVICDDIRRPAGGPRASRAVERFTAGWRVNTLVDRDELRALAGDAGFEHETTTDLTPWLELGRPRDRLISAFVWLFGWLPLGGTRLGHLPGGAALQRCLANGWVGYDLAVFRRTGG